MEVERKIFANTLSLATGQILAQLANFAFVILFARTFGAQTLGVYSFALAIGALVASFVSCGTISLASKEISRDPPVDRELIGQILPMQILTGIVVWSIASITTLWIYENNENAQVVILGVAFHVVLVWQALLLTRFQSRQLMLFVAATGVAMRAGILIFGVVGILLLKNVPWSVAAFPFSAFITLSFVHFSGSRRFGAPALTLALADIRRVMRRAWPFMSIALLSVLYGRLGVVLLRLMQSDEAVGYFSSAERLLVPFVGVTAVFCAAVFPALTRVSPELRSERDALARRFLRVLLALILPAATLVYLYRTDIILLLYGQGFAEAVSVLTVLAWVISLRGLNQFLAIFSISADLQSRLGALKLLTLAIFLLACFALIPRFSFLGLAYATVIAESSLAIVMLWTLKNDNLLRGAVGILWPPAICCVAMIIATLNLTMVTLGVRVVLSLATFITAAFLTGAITRHDIGFLLRIAKSGRATDSYSIQLDDD